MILDRFKMNVYVSWILAILLMILIYQFSSQVADDSNKLSTGITEKVVVQVNKIIEPDIEVKSFNHYIRKSAHFSIYMLLGILFMNAFTKGQLSLKYCYLFSFGLTMLYAISDEVHQHFVPGRGPSINDVGIDTLGALLGITLYLIILKQLRKGV
jgi:VanZ family protein